MLIKYSCLSGRGAHTTKTNAALILHKNKINKQVKHENQNPKWKLFSSKTDIVLQLFLFR